MSRLLSEELDDHTPGRICTQQILVGKLLTLFIDEMGGDVRFEIDEVQLSNEDGQRPEIHFTDSQGAQRTVTCDYIAGCDGDRGISRDSIPQGFITTYTHDYGYAWLAALVDAPLSGHPILSVSDRGYSAQFSRGPGKSRYYLQCPIDDTVADWPDDRVWKELRSRLFDDELAEAQIVEKTLFPLRSVVHAPMQHRNLFLVGDSAHIVPPASAKGMNMALYDVDVLARAVVSARNGDNAALDAYSETCLRRIWNYEEFALWLTDLLHDAGDTGLRGEFLRMTARARLARLYDSPTALRLYSEMMAGTN